jgi:hypothetical protein
VYRTARCGWNEEIIVYCLNPKEVLEKMLLSNARGVVFPVF